MFHFLLNLNFVVLKSSSNFYTNIFIFVLLSMFVVCYCLLLVVFFFCVECLFFIICCLKFEIDVILNVM